MTNPPLVGDSKPRILLPGFVSGFFVAALVFLLFGGFLGQVHGDGTRDYEIFQTRLGTVLFWVGVASAMTGFILIGVRSIAQQQLDILLAAANRK